MNQNAKRLSVDGIAEHAVVNEILKISERRLWALSAPIILDQQSEIKQAARELHDNIAQILNDIKGTMESTLRQMDENQVSGEIRDSVEAVIPIMKSAIEGVRGVLSNLQPSNPIEPEVISALSCLCQEFQYLHPWVRLKREIDVEEKEIPAILKGTLLRVIQGALKTIVKNNQVDSVFISLLKIGRMLELTIRYNDPGTPSKTPLHPSESRKETRLNGVRSRTALFGESLFIRSTKGKGTVLRAVWSL